MSLDGFIAGINRSRQNPMGDGGERLGEWRRELAVFRKKFLFAGLEGGVTNASTDGPWGGNPFQVPVFVLTHHPRQPLVLHGDPLLTFVTEGISAALEMAEKAAAGKDVLVGGSASAAKQYLDAGLLDEINIHLVPVFVGEGLRVFDDAALAGVTLEQVRVVEAPGVTHLRFRVVR